MNEPRLSGHGGAAATILSSAGPARPAGQTEAANQGPPDGAARLERLIGSQALRAMLMHPAYLAPSAWVEHVPFAFWLVEAQRPRSIVELGTHWGVSYFAFCQAVERLGLDTRCYAVDHWQGDAHSGSYGEEVFEQVNAQNEAHYAGFSRLVRSSFDAAAGHFENGSIDLLHIDGLHTLEAVRHDFETWAPKLSARGVLVLHDSNVRERDFGVFRLVEELRQRYPAFEFLHGHGLAVLGVGGDQAEGVDRLLGAGRDAAARRALRQVFARLGQACADAQARQEFEARRKLLQTSVNSRKRQISKLTASLEATRSELDQRSAEAVEAGTRLERQAAEAAAERGQLAERARLLESLREEGGAEAARLRAGAEAAQAELKVRTDALIAAQEQLQAQQRQLGALEAAEARQAAAGKTAEAELERLREALAALGPERDAAEAARAEARAELETERAARAAAEAALAEAEARMARDSTALAEMRAWLSASEEAAETREAALAAEVEAARQDLLAERADHAATADAVEAERIGAAALRAELEEKRQALGSARAERAAAAEQAAAAEAARARAEDALEAQRAAAAAAEAHLETERAGHAARQRVGEAERGRLRREVEDARLKLDEGVAELAKLTRLLEATESRVAELETAEAACAEAEQALARERAAAAEAARGHEAALESARAERDRLNGQRDGLVVERDKLRRARDSLTAERDRLKGQRDGLVVERDKLKGQRDRLTAECDKLKGARNNVTAERDRLAGEVEGARARLTEHTAELTRLTGLLETAEGRAQALGRQLAGMRRARWAVARLVGRAIMAFGRYAPERPPRPRVLRRLAARLIEAGVFDPDWYLASNRDVAEAGLDPVRHYLIDGVREGREPRDISTLVAPEGRRDAT